jgi:hypothetical protein
MTIRTQGNTPQTLACRRQGMRLYLEETPSERLFHLFPDLSPDEGCQQLEPHDVPSEKPDSCPCTSPIKFTIDEMQNNRDRDARY